MCDSHLVVEPVGRRFGFSIDSSSPVAAKVVEMTKDDNHRPAGGSGGYYQGHTGASGAQGAPVVLW